MNEEQPKPATAKINSYFELASVSAIFPLLAFIFGLVLARVQVGGVVVFGLMILALAFGFGLSIFSIFVGFRRQMVGTLILGSIGFVLNGGSLYYMSGMWLFLSNLRC